MDVSIQCPKGKLPFITHAGEKVADSTFIIRYLVDAGLSRDLDAELTAVQRAESRAWQVYMEEMVYPCVVYERWMIKENYDTISQTAFAAIPWLLIPLVAAYFHRRISQGLNGKGVGQHSVEEVRSILRGAVDDFAARLEGHTFFHDTAKATGIDVIIYAFLSNSLDCPANPFFSQLVLSKTSLVRFVRLMTETLFPEYERLLALVSKNVSGDAIS